MKKYRKLILMVAFALILTACSKDSELTVWFSEKVSDMSIGTFIITLLVTTILGNTLTKD